MTSQNFHPATRLRLAAPPAAMTGTAAGCPCLRGTPAAAGTLGDVPEWLSDWRTWALIAAAVMIVVLLLASTPKKQERAVKLRASRERYRAEQKKIREEFA